MAMDSTQPDLPWQLVPAFDPATSNYDNYKAKIQLLLMTWPAKFKKELAVRIAIQTTGTAWDKLKTMMDKIGAEDGSGVRAILSSLERWADSDDQKLFDRLRTLSSHPLVEQTSRCRASTTAWTRPSGTSRTQNREHPRLHP